MKREQAVLAIAECLVEPHFDDPEKEADCILKRLERLGMLPPFSEKRYYDTGMRNGYMWDVDDKEKQ